MDITNEETDLRNIGGIKIEKRPVGRPRLSDREPQRLSREQAREMLKDYDEDNKFELTEDEKLDFVERGMSAEWKRHEIRGKEDVSHQTNLRQRGYWTSVPGSRLSRFGFSGDSPIIIDEMILMERPIELTEERRRRDRNKANAQVSGQMDALEITKSGHMERTKPKVKRTVESIPD